jgi:hypothetical protein
LEAKNARHGIVHQHGPHSGRLHAKETKGTE